MNVCNCVYDVIYSEKLNCGREEERRKKEKELKCNFRNQKVFDYIHL